MRFGNWNMEPGKTAPRPPLEPGAYASGVWFSASRRKPCAPNLPPPEIPGPLVGREFGRDARTGTRDACASQTGRAGGSGKISRRPGWQGSLAEKIFPEFSYRLEPH